MTPKRQKEGKSRIPDFASREEEAAFFDTHDMADYQDEFATLDARFAENLLGGILLELDPKALAALRERAQAEGASEAALARRWVLERLREVEGGAPPTG